MYRYIQPCLAAIGYFRYPNVSTAYLVHNQREKRQMACGSSFYEDNPVKDKMRDDAAAAKHLKAAKTMADFFEVDTGLCCLVEKVPSDDIRPTRAEVHVTEKGVRVAHRGHDISVACHNPPEIAQQFRKWVSRHMTHITQLNYSEA